MLFLKNTVTEVISCDLFFVKVKCIPKNIVTQESQLWLVILNILWQL